MSDKIMPVLFVPHGGGPMPLLGEANHRELTAFMKSVSADLPRPTAIVVITAHWEENIATISNSPAPGMLYDYSGFPPKSYEFKYPVAGDPALAQQIAALLEAQGLKSRLDAARDLDHGSFVPLMLMYPHANIPVVQLSLLKSLDPAAHIALGKVLAPLREQGVLILGSGMSFHNMRAFFSANPSTQARSEDFDDWLTETITQDGLTAEDRAARLVDWKNAPEALFCHPREEHLLPLHVCFGAGSIASPVATKVFSGFLFNTKISAFLWS
ncbi:dioxygenase [Cellvibrio zantedeschiae]|uniref:Dioxygenase n=1 Tax=Cellvibrio zantedeschiae TaxID=1237077 RepID=A0ABQ3B1C3_9GAMM|nr:class III extradiol ring-cleavage dioxygenase [Cellvibrio zantedeschiae]GGY73411.1 dioxygenase [Cellvibrio zantedeschiae]